VFTPVNLLKQISKPAGNINFYSIDSSPETLCTEIVQPAESISLHPPVHQKPFSNDDFGHYLAGLIEADGYFGIAKTVSIYFHSFDIGLAYYLRERLGVGYVSRIKDKEAFEFTIYSNTGVKKILSLVYNKIRCEKKFTQIINNIVNTDGFVDIRQGLPFARNVSNDFNNSWLAGFADADASFQIKLVRRTETKQEARLNFQVNQKTAPLLELIKGQFGGHIGHRKTQDTYYYGTTSFVRARKVIEYFDKFHLQSNKYTNYLKWRHAYLIIQDRRHLTPAG